MIDETGLRLKNIREQMLPLHAEACLISSMVNLYYLNNKIYKGYCYLPEQGDVLHFVRRPVDLKAEDLGFHPIIGSQDTNLFFIRKPEQISGILLENGNKLPERLMLEGDEISYAEWTRLQTCFPETTFINGSHALRKARSVKTAFELKLIRLSAEKHVKSYLHIPEIFRPGMTDIELSIELERIMRLEGNLGLFRTYGGDMEVFMGSILTGDNAAASSPYNFALGGAGHPSNPVGANGTVLKEGQSVMVDMAGNFTGYLDDITRTFSVGKLSEAAYKAHQVALEVQDYVQKNLKEGTVCSQLYEQACKIVAHHGLTDCFMGSRQQANFIGHGVGLVINELPVIAPRINDVLLPDMVLAVEPKFIIGGVGAVGTENTFIVGKHQGEKITLLNEDIVDLVNH